jgi:IclR family transcriptional regulator, mhp operon transcriptional activator
LFRIANLGRAMPKTTANRRSTDIQSVMRVLSVIEVLNQDSVTSVDVAYRLTGLPKPTLSRILGTLVTAGYVTQVSRRDGYALTERILRLSAGFRYNDAIVDIARPPFEAFTLKHKWQLTIATLDTDAMLVRYNTRHISPFAPHVRFLNRRLHVPACAVGRAYLAYCSQAEREVILSFLRSTDNGAISAPYDRRIDDMIEAVRGKTYATVERRPDDSSRSFAIPILSKTTGAAVAAIAMSYYSSALTESQATGRYLEELYGIADQIASALHEMGESAVPPAPLPDAG